MEESSWERPFLDRVQGIVRSNSHNRATPLLLEVESTIGMVVNNWEPPEDSMWDIYRDLCQSAHAGKSRAWLRMRLRYQTLSGPDLIASAWSIQERSNARYLN